METKCAVCGLGLKEQVTLKEIETIVNVEGKKKLTVCEEGTCQTAFMPVKNELEPQEPGE